MLATLRHSWRLRDSDYKHDALGTSRDTSFLSPLWRQSSLWLHSGEHVEEEEEAASVAAPLSRSPLNYSCPSCLTAAGILKEPEESDKDGPDYTENHTSLWNRINMQTVPKRPALSWLNMEVKLCLEQFCQSLYVSRFHCCCDTLSSGRLRPKSALK